MDRRLSKLNLIFGANILKHHYDKYSAKTMEHFSLTLTEGSLLFLIDHFGGKSTARELGDITMLSKSMISRNIESLVRQGFLIAKIDENDRRFTILSLTEKAKPIVSAFQKSDDEVMQKLLKGISEDELQKANDIFRQMCDNMRGEQ